MYDVIGEIIPTPRFDALMKDWLARRRTMTEILAEIDLQTDEEQVARLRADMHNQALGSRYIDMSKLIADVQQSKENRLMPEYIERFFLEAYRSFGGTITPVKGQQRCLVDQPDSARLAQTCLNRSNASTAKSARSIRNSPSTRSRSSAIPTSNSSGQGIRCLRALSSACCGNTDPHSGRARASTTPTPQQPTVLWLLKCGVEDGRGHMVGERLFAIHHTHDTYRKSQPYALLDLKSPEGDVDVAADVRQSATAEDQVIDWSLDEVTPVVLWGDRSASEE